MSSHTPLASLSEYDRYVCIAALKEFPKLSRHMTNPAMFTLNKKVAKSVKNKIEVKATLFNANEIRILFLALSLFEQLIMDAPQEAETNKMMETFDKLLPTLEELVHKIESTLS